MPRSKEVMLDFSEENIKKHCPHCGPETFAFSHPLKQTENFWVICDVHPLGEGHILIMPKKHLSCVGEYSEVIYQEFKKLYTEVTDFLKKEHGLVSSFEHGKIGQTVFHSHVHLLPFSGKSGQIVPEGEDKLTKISGIDDLRKIFLEQGKYLFFSIGDKSWTVDPALSAPGFFRDRFARALGNPERGNWKEMRQDKHTMKRATDEIMRLEKEWNDG